MNHRPTLEGKRGYEKSIKDTIQHARLLKSHTKLKYRLDVSAEEVLYEQKRHKAGPASEDESVTSEFKPAVENSSEYKKLEGNGDVLEHLKDPETINSLEKPIQEYYDDDDKEEKTSSEQSNALDTKREASNNSEANTSSGDNRDDFESDSDSESDSEALQAELDALRKEKEREVKVEVANATAPPKKSWRSSRPFAKKETKATDQYTVNTVQSSTHKQFMSKYVR